MKNNIEKNISLKNALNKTQYNLFYMFADPFKITSNDIYTKIKAINNVDNNIKYYIYKNKRKNRKKISEEEILPRKRKNNHSIKTLNSISNSSSKKLEYSLKRNNLKSKEISHDKINPNEPKTYKNEVHINSIKYNKINTPKKANFSELNKFARLSKLNDDYKKIIRGKLDKELVINQNIGNNTNNDKENKINRILLSEKTKRIPSLKLNNNDLHKIYKSVKADNKIFNNCIIQEKIIYDIKPLNKLKEKGKCIFPKKINDKKNRTESLSLKNNIFFDNYTNKNRNDNFNLTYNNNNLNANAFKNEEDNENIKKTITHINQSKKISKEKSFNDIHNKNIDSKRLRGCTTPTKIKKENKENKNYRTNRNFYLNDLYKDLPTFEKNKSKNIFIFYKDGIGVTRGEKLKFLKTSYPINLIKPLNTQKIFKLKMPDKIEEKKGKIFKKFPINHYNLDIVNRNNNQLINNLNALQKNISDKIKKEFLFLYNSINNNNINELDLNH